MEIIKRDFKHGFAVVKIKDIEDLWYLSSIIDKGDVVKGKTLRKIKLGEKAVITKSVTLFIRVEKIEFKKEVLRVSGKIENEVEDIPKGSYHTINVELNDIITIEKEKFLEHQIKYLEESKEIKSKILICAFDREEAHFAIVKKNGYEYLGDLKGEVSKKGFDVKGSNFYAEIISRIKEYVERFKIEKIIVASPSFWKDYLIEELKRKDKDLLKKIRTASCGDVGKNAIKEILKRQEVLDVLKSERASEELRLIDELMKDISKENAVYGIKEVREALEIGAIKTLLISDKMIEKYREDNNYKELDGIMKGVDKTKGEIMIISDEESVRKLNGLGGIAALLRFKMKY